MTTPCQSCKKALLCVAAQGDRFGIARSLREIAWVRFKQGQEQDTMAAAQAAYVLQSELGDLQGVADSRFFLALSHLCCGDWQHAKELLEPVWHFAEEMNVAIYQRWALSALTIATCMEENMHHLQSASCSFPNRFNRFTTRLMHVFFAITDPGIAYVRNIEMLLGLATTDLEMAVCCPFVADLLSRSGNRPKAVMLLALAYRDAVVAEGWIALHPQIRAVQQALRDSLSPVDFEHAWQAGRLLDLQSTVAELLSADNQAMFSATSSLC